WMAHHVYIFECTGAANKIHTLLCTYNFSVNKGWLFPASPLLCFFSHLVFLDSCFLIDMFKAVEYFNMTYYLALPCSESVLQDYLIINSQTKLEMHNLKRQVVSVMYTVGITMSND